MKYLLSTLTLLVTGCTTVYKVDANGVCRAPNGKIVPIPDIGFPEWACGNGRPVHTVNNTDCYPPSPGTWWSQKAGTCCGW